MAKLERASSTKRFSWAWTCSDRSSSNLALLIAFATHEAHWRLCLTLLGLYFGFEEYCSLYSMLPLLNLESPMEHSNPQDSCTHSRCRRLFNQVRELFWFAKLRRMP